MAIKTNLESNKENENKTINNRLKEAIKKLQARAYMLGFMASINQNFTSKYDLYKISEEAYDVGVELSDCDIEEIYPSGGWDYNSQLDKWIQEVKKQESLILNEIKEIIKGELI